MLKSALFSLPVPESERPLADGPATRTDVPVEDAVAARHAGPTAVVVLVSTVRADEVHIVEARAEAFERIRPTGLIERHTLT